MSVLRLYLLGTLNLSYDDCTLDKPPTAKSQSLLAYLALHRQDPQSRERLCALFWGERAKRRARSSLSTSLWHIRRCLPDEALILSDPQTVQFDPQADLWLDTQAFESAASREDVAGLQSAVALYRGDLLDGFYDDWIITERNRLEELFADTLARLMVEQEATGVLHVEAPSMPAGRHPLDVIEPGVLAGREQEMASLHEYWQKVEAGQGGLILIDGEVGVGKTRLVEEFADQLHGRGACVLWGRSYEPERSLPYQPVADAIRTMLPTLSPTELSNLPAWVIAEVGRLMPEIAESYPDLSAPVSIQADRERARFFNGIARFLAELATHGPLLIVLEDLHWATRSTLQLIHYLTRRLADKSVLLVGTLRPEEMDQEHPLLVLIRELKRDGVCHTLHLDGLSSEAVLTMVQAMSGADENVLPLARRLYRETEGNPFFLMEVVKALFETGELRLEAGVWRGDFVQISEESLPLPAGLSEVIQGRVRRLDEETQDALCLAAVLGHEFDFELLDAAWGRDREATLAALDALLRRRLVDESSGLLERDYAFTHHELQRVVYAGIPQSRRQHLHGLAGTAMEQLYEPQSVMLLAFHFEQAQDVDGALAQKAVIYLRGAGEQAAFQFANAEALSYFGRALALTPEQDSAARFDILLARERVYELEGEKDAQVRDLESLQELSRHLSFERQVEATVLRARYATQIGDYQDVVAFARDAIRLAESCEEKHVAAEAHLYWGQALVRQGENERARVHYMEALALAQTGQQRRLEGDCLKGLGVVAYRGGGYAAAKRYYELALRIFTEIDDKLGQSASLNNLGALCYEQGDKAASKAFYEQALHISREAGYQFGECALHGNLGQVAVAQGDYIQAFHYYEQSLAMARETGLRDSEVDALNNLGAVHSRLGQWKDAADAHESALQVCRQTGYRVGEAWALVGLSLCTHCVGDDTAALAHAQQALSIAREAGIRVAQGYAFTYLGHAQMGLGDLVAAATFYRQAVTLRTPSQPHLVVVPLAGLVSTSLLQGDAAQARAHAEEVLHYLSSGTLDGVDEPGWVCLSCYRALEANQDPRAEEILKVAYDMLQERAAKISDEALRRSFLENVAANREVIEAWDGR